MYRSSAFTVSQKIMGMQDRMESYRFFFDISGNRNFDNEMINMEERMIVDKEFNNNELMKSIEILSHYDIVLLPRITYNLGRFVLYLVDNNSVHIVVDIFILPFLILLLLLLLLCFNEYRYSWLPI